MSVKFGLLTNPAKDILEEIRIIQDLGFDYVEIGIEFPGGSPELVMAQKNKILALTKKFHHPPLAHTAWWLDFASLHPKIRKNWIDEAKLSIDAAKSLNIEKINFHFYSLGLEYKNYHEELLKNMIKSLRDIVSYADSKKITVFLENTPNKRYVIGIEEYKFVIDNVPKLKSHLDVGHAFVENGMKSVKEYIFTFKDNLEHIHMHDNHGEGDEHLPLGKGKINFDQIAKWLKQINYNKTITFEVFTSKEDAKESMLKFKNAFYKS